MASTPNKKNTTPVGKTAKNSSKRSPKPQQNAPKQSKSLGSMGLSLLLTAIGTSLIGLGVLGYLVYQELLGSAKREVDRSAEAQTRQIERKLANVQQSVDGVANASRLVSQQQPKPKGGEPYQKLLVEGLQRSEPIAGMGIAQNENMLFTTAKPFVPYVWKEQSGLKLETLGQKLSAPNDKLLFGNRLNSPSYKTASVKGKELWSEPYNAFGKTIITYSVPITDGQKTLGIVSADAIATNLLPIAAVNPSASSESKIGFVVVSANGKVITASDQFQLTQAQNPAITESLNSLAQQSKAQPVGIAQTGGNLWAYQKIEGSDWLVVTYLPEAEIFNKLLILVGGVAIGLSAILAIAILSFVDSLKKRLKPLSEECDRFLTQQGHSNLNNLAGKDEIDHLRLSLESTLQRVKTNEVHLKSSQVTATSSIDDISSAQMQQSFAETELMEAEVGDLLDVVSSMEEGDLTIEAQVNDRATGLVADTLNRLREKLVEIISSVLGTAQQVAQGASDLEELTKTVVLNTAEQAQSVTQGQALTEQVAMIASRSAAQVNVANQSLQEVRDTVTSGQTAINTLTESISVLQTGSAQIVQRMKTLGEFVGLAEQFVQDQGQIASLTQVLALNATLVAARGAEQKDPKQFASVAREFESIAGQVNDLATQTNNGLTVLQQRTSQIQTVVTAIDVEVQNLSGLVTGFTTGVEESQSAFDSIQSATEEVVQIGQTITESSTEIAEAAGSTASYISEIAQLAERTANLTRSARQQAESMGNQAQQLLQGIQFFRLPNVSVDTTQAFTANPISNIATMPSVDTSPNSLLESSPDLPRSADDNRSGLGLVVPAIALATAATAVTISQSEQHDSSARYIAPDPNIDDLDDSEYLIEEGLSSSSFTENPDPLSLVDLDYYTDQDFATPIENFLSEDESIDAFLGIADSQDQTSESSYLDMPDISAIEDSLFADLRQEIYDDNLDESLEDADDDLSLDAQPTLKNPMEGVNELAIMDASSDPMIVSATSSFLEDTNFGTPSQLSEDSLANIPKSLDFTIPDLGDDDFTIFSMPMESTLDDSSSFFDTGSVQQFKSNDSDVDLDPFSINPPLTESSDHSSEEDIFELDSLDESNTENTFEENIFEKNVSNVSEDYNDYISHEEINESLESSLGNLTNEAYSDTFDASFDEPPFDIAFDEASTDSLDDSFDGLLFDGLVTELSDENASGSEANDVLSLDPLSSQAPDIYLAESFDDSEGFSFELEDNSSINSNDLADSDILNSSTIIQNREKFVDHTDRLAIQENSSFDNFLEELSDGETSEQDVSYLLNLDQQSDQSSDRSLNNFENQENLAESSTSTPDIYVDELEEFSFELEDSSSIGFSDLADSEILNDSAVIQDSEEFVDYADPLAIQRDDPFNTSFDNLLEDLSEEETSEQDVSYLLDLDQPSDQQSDQSLDNFKAPEDLAELSTQIPDIYLTESSDDSDPEEFSFELEDSSSISFSDLSDSDILNDSTIIQDSEDFIDYADPFDFPSAIQEEDSLALEFAIAPESTIQEKAISNLPDEQLETAFPSLFDISAEDALEDEFTGSIWESDGSIPDVSDVQENLPQSEISYVSESVNSPNSEFELPDFSEILETDDVSLDEVFNFDVSNDFDSLSSLLESEESYIVPNDELISDSDLTSMFSVVNDNFNTEPEFGFEESLNIDREDSLNVLEEAINEEGFGEKIEFDIDIIDFGEALESSGSILENPLDPVESMESMDLSTDESLSNNLNLEFFENLVDTSTSETDGVKLSKESDESVPDLSMDFSDSWLEEIINEEEDIDNFADLAIEYPSMNEVSADSSTESAYGFADNLLDSLMEESEDEPVDLSDFSTNFDLSAAAEFGSVNSENENNKSNDNSESQFNFFTTDGLVDAPEDLIVTARAEIDDFLLGVIDIEEFDDEIPKSNAEESGSLNTESNPNKTNNPITNDRA